MNLRYFYYLMHLTLKFFFLTSWGRAIKKEYEYSKSNHYVYVFIYILRTFTMHITQMLQLQILFIIQSSHQIKNLFMYSTYFPQIFQITLITTQYFFFLFKILIILITSMYASTCMLDKRQCILCFWNSQTCVYLITFSLSVLCKLALY